MSVQVLPELPPYTPFLYGSVILYETFKLVNLSISLIMPLLIFLPLHIKVTPCLHCKLSGESSSCHKGNT